MRMFQLINADINEHQAQFETLTSEAIDLNQESVKRKAAELCQVYITTKQLAQVSYGVNYCSHFTPVFSSAYRFNSKQVCSLFVYLRKL